MIIIKDKEKKFDDAFIKVLSTINGCTSPEQLQIASNLFNNFKVLFNKEKRFNIANTMLDGRIKNKLLTLNII